VLIRSFVVPSLATTALCWAVATVLVSQIRHDVALGANVLSWSTLTNLEVPRCHATMVTTQGRLYLVGGRAPVDKSPGKSVSLNTIDRYNPYSDSWQLIAKLRSARHDHGCAAVGQFVCYKRPLLSDNVSVCLSVRISPSWRRRLPACLSFRPGVYKLIVKCCSSGQCVVRGAVQNFVIDCVQCSKK